MSETDLQLLTRYTRHKAEDAFAEIVRRHLDLVHSAALRQVRSSHLAEEVAQAVFTDLARQAHLLPLDTVLPAWLYQVTRRSAIDVVRRETSRHLREQAAHELHAMNATAADWTHIEPLLDEAMHALDETDRAAVLLRYFENKSFREVGETLGSSDDAAQKRVSRAVERLREFFTKRGITVGASGLGLVISTNAVLAAPAGLSAIITTAALEGITFATTTIATATKAIAMTTLQKTLIAALLVTAVGAGIYEARRASIARVQRLQQGMLMTDQIQQLTAERDEATRKLAVLQDDSENLNRATAELVKLRGDVTRLKAELQQMASSKADIINDQTLSEALVWKNRVNQLKQSLERSPAAKIPELQLVTEQDWLNAARGKLDTEADYRRALSAIRNAGENKVASMIRTALTRYKQANNEQFPTDLNQLQPYFESPMDEATLRRWEIAPATTIQGLGLGGDMIITQKAPVDDVFDTRYAVGLHGSGATDFLSQDSRFLLAPIREAYRAAHNGQPAVNNSELLPYATTPEQQAALQKLILRDSTSK